VTVVSARGLVKTYGRGRAARRVLDGADIDARAGELVAVVGRSGSGKSTLLHVLGALDRPEAGTIEVAGERIDGPPSGSSPASGAARSASSSSSSTSSRS